MLANIDSCVSLGVYPGLALLNMYLAWDQLC